METTASVSPAEDEQNPQQEVGKYRRNGFQQSCEPCRLSKLKCDHCTPCSRCVRRGATCVYHPAPMTKSGQRSPSHPSTACRTPTPRNTQSSQVSPRPKKRVKHEHAPETPAIDTPVPFSYDILNPKLSLGYTGATGASSILLEHEPSMRGFTNPHFEVDDDDKERKSRSAARLKYSAHLLASLPDQSVVTAVLDSYMKSHQVCFFQQFRHIIIAFNSSFWDTFQSYMQKPRKLEKLTQLANVIHYNTAQSVSIPKSNDEWFTSTIGNKSRWEMIGILFYLCSMHVRLGPVADPAVQQLKSPDGCAQKASVTYFYCAESCLHLCESLDTQSHILGAALRDRLLTLQSILEGDTSFDLWRKAGAMLSDLTAMGAHRELESRGRVSLLYAEERKHQFFSAYSVILDIACFNGRPSPLRQSYVSVELPLDVTFEILLSDDWEVALSSVNEVGWNKSGKITQFTMARMYALTSLLRDQVMELALSRPTDDMQFQIERVRRRLHEAYATAPKPFQPPFDREAAISATSIDTLHMTKTHLMRLQLTFLLERINYPGKPKSEADASLDAAREATDIVNLIWMHRDPILEHQGRDIIHWTICCHGIQSASAIAIDLLRTTRSDRRSLNPVRRAETIQALSVFIAALGWMKPDDGNYELCNRSKRAIKQILDRALDTSAIPESTPSIPSVATPTAPPIDIPNGNSKFSEDWTQLPALGPEFETWLENTDWMSMPFGLDNDWINFQMGSQGQNNHL